MNIFKSVIKSVYKVNAPRRVRPFSPLANFIICILSRGKHIIGKLVIAPCYTVIIVECS